MGLVQKEDSMAKHTTKTAEEFVNESNATSKPEDFNSQDTPVFDATKPPDGWLEEATGFPPYWSPEINGGFRAVPLMIDLREPEFVRYVLRATVPVECWKGPSDEAEGVTVQPGQTFTCSAYAAMRLDQYFGHEVMVYATGKRDLTMGKKLWQFRVFVSPQTRKLLDAQRAEEAKRLSAESKKAPF